jgi:hypothetical protein
MQENEHEWQSNQDEAQAENALEQSLVPSSLLSNVLQHLDLSPEQAPSEQALEDLLLKLRSGMWQERTQALQTLGKMENAVSLDLLAPLLHDADETVRATTLYVLGTISGQVQVPLHWLVEALQDKNWHVRETAVFALAQQGTRVPIEIIMTALHDRDGSVREAASFVLQQRSGDAMASALYGQLREETAMQSELYDPTHSNSKQNGHTPITAADGEWNSTFMEYSGNAARGHTVNEQMQVYASGYHAPHEPMQQEFSHEGYAEAMAARNEKVTSYRLRKKSHIGWWIATIIITAILFFGLGFGLLSITNVSSRVVGGFKQSSSAMPAMSNADPTQSFLFDEPSYAAIMQNALSNALHLTPQQILEQVKQLGSLDAVAAQQGVSSSQLYVVEMDAFNQIANAATKTGKTTPDSASSMITLLSNNNDLRSQVVLKLLGTGGSK